ncbi:hypothetical protein Ciccas_012399 [Cichlidogyrus casuarinus]|uniref:Proteasome assembly chaperone 1 n=1 Tax=Cichlidogyrus casuarinus TaxID=1844966 RepID=A0ABD2PNH4_9PLAT
MCDFDANLFLYDADTSSDEEEIVSVSQDKSCLAPEDLDSVEYVYFFVGSISCAMISNSLLTSRSIQSIKVEYSENKSFTCSLHKLDDKLLWIVPENREIFGAANNLAEILMSKANLPPKPIIQIFDSRPVSSMKDNLGKQFLFAVKNSHFHQPCSFPNLGPSESIGGVSAALLTLAEIRCIPAVIFVGYHSSMADSITSVIELKQFMTLLSSPIGTILRLDFDLKNKEALKQVQGSRDRTHELMFV